MLQSAYLACDSIDRIVAAVLSEMCRWPSSDLNCAHNCCSPDSVCPIVLKDPYIFENVDCSAVGNRLTRPACEAASQRNVSMFQTGGREIQVSGAGTVPTEASSMNCPISSSRRWVQGSDAKRSDSPP